MRIAMALLAAAYGLAACTSIDSEREWRRHDFNLTGKHVRISAPHGDLGDKTAVALTPALDLTLLQRAWIFSSAGAVEVKLAVHRFDEGSSGELFEKVSHRMLREVQRVFPDAQVSLIGTRNIGGKAWTCYVVSRISISECVLEVDRESYLSWRAYWIANSQPAVPEPAKRLIEKVESSIEIAF
jgi:hypothetical protein